MKNLKCANCSLRKKYDKNPKSFLGRLWRWHINFCPGWKTYFKSLDEKEKLLLADKYNFRKYF